MKYTQIILILGFLAAALVLADPAGAFENRPYAGGGPWHAQYYNVAWGMPVALVVPPTAGSQTNYRWGVGGTRVTPMHAQFSRSWPGPGYFDRRGFQPTPVWPSDTNQFGVYYVRGPGKPATRRLRPNHSLSFATRVVRSDRAAPVFRFPPPLEFARSVLHQLKMEIPCHLALDQPPSEDD